MIPLWLQAALEFERTTIPWTARPADTEMVAIFPFKNTGESAEEIVKLDSSCGCTVAELAKRVYQPGESGEIRAVFTFGERVGKQIKTIGVVTANAVGKPVVLRMEATIPDVLAVSQKLVVFSGAGQEQSRTITIKTDAGLTLEELTATPGDDSFQATLGTHPVSKQRTLTITRPPAAARKSVLITARFADGLTKSIRVWVMVRPERTKEHSPSESK
ncbi:MAG: DUF1573 domain-containing protein [Opitutaceae bacterium]|jgi:hypothetical protein|nr:DUF1573 domain-containing protein [Opitutaceae bacterium]